MAINLDEIVAGANSVDELLSAISAESKSNALASTQLAQLREASQGLVNPTQLIQKRITESAAPSQPRQQLPLEDSLYQKYVEATATKGTPPVSKDDFLKAIEEHKAKLTQSKTASK